MARGRLLVAFALSLACGDDTGAAAGTSGGSTAGDDTGPTATGDTADDGSDVASDTADASTSSTTSDATDDGSTSSASTSDGSTSGASSSDGSGSDTGAIDCTLPTPPLSASTFTTGLMDANDLVFDGAGHLLAKNGDDIVSVDSDEQSQLFATVPGYSYGLRLRANGDAVIALPITDVVAQVAEGGMATNLATGLGLPNLIHVDSDDRVWFTDPGQSAVLRIETDGTVAPIVTGAGASSAGGIVLDEARAILWFTHGTAGQLRFAPIDDAGDAGKVEILTTIAGRLGGLALDACGNLYGIDDENARLYRFALDEAGALIGDAEELVTFANGVYSAQFGRGEGFSETSLYAVGPPGTVFVVDVGVPGQ